jgi:excinuclease ABC subunit A
MRRTEELTLSNQNFDPETGYRYGEITPRHFSFNSPQGACPVCDGLGTESVFDPALIIPEPVTLEDMPVAPWRRASAALEKLYKGQRSPPLAEAFNEPLSRPYRECSDAFQHALIYGTGEEKIRFTTTRGGKDVTSERPFEGVIAQLNRLHARVKASSRASAQPVHDAHYLPRVPRRAPAARGAGGDHRGTTNPG